MSDGHAEGTIIAIQCPSCKTKFGVDGGVLGQVARPRFHCSKCDTTFSKSLASIMTALSRVSGESSAGASQRPQSRDTVVGPSYHRSVEYSPVVSPPPPQPAASPAPDAVKSAVEPVAAARQSSSPQTPNSRPSSTGDSRVSETNHQVGEESSTVTRENQDSGTRISPLATMMKHAAVDETIFSRLQLPPESPSSSRATAGTEFPNSALGARSAGGWGRRWGNPESSLHRVVFAVMPLLVIQLLLVAVTLLVVRDPRSLGALHAGVVSSAVRVPPSEIAIINAEFRKQDLDDGESIYIVSGQVANRTGRAFSQIQVQGLTFDELGRPLQKAVGTAGSSLTTARLSSLSTKMIADLQEVSLRKNVRVESRGNADFTIVLVPRDRRPAFFSARVFAVGAAR